MKDLIKVYTPVRLTPFRPVLESWAQAVLRYCKIHKFESNSWWHGERASLSTLAGAAWALPGWSALEEFNTLKRRVKVVEMVDKSHIGHGRCDLYISSKKVCFAIEAKQAWQSLGKDSDKRLTIDRVMKSAWDDAASLQHDEADYRLAITFVVPTLPMSQATQKVGGKRVADEPKTREHVEAWLKSEKFEQGSRKAPAYAYVFPKSSKHFVGSVDSRVFPGVVLVVELRSRGTRISKLY